MKTKTLAQICKCYEKLKKRQRERKKFEFDNIKKCTYTMTK